MRWINGVCVGLGAFGLGACGLVLGPVRICAAETMSGALSAAYRNNPDLNQQRAATRASDERVAKANSGYRPTVKGDASVGYRNSEITRGNSVVNGRTGTTYPSGAGISVEENVFDGNRTANRVRDAESKVFEARERLRETEQTILTDGATAYMDVLRDIAVLNLQKNEVTVLETRLREARARVAAQTRTITDVAQVASYLAAARSAYFTAQSALTRSIADYRRVIGINPKHLDAARPIDGLLPSDLTSAVEAALRNHPKIQAATNRQDQAESEILIRIGALYPTLSVKDRLEQMNQEGNRSDNKRFTNKLQADLSVPIYTDGGDYARIREAKEQLSKARFEVESAREAVRAQVATTWSRLQTSKSLIVSSQVAVKAAEAALEEVREEAKLGQRTTLNVLMATQTLLQARVSLVRAEHDRVTASYSVMAAAGRLSAANLGLGGVLYDPTVHFDQVKDKWIGLRTPDGR